MTMKLIADVRTYFMGLQDLICARLESLEPERRFSREEILPPPEAPPGGLARPRVIADGEVIEKAAVQFTHSLGASLPPAATERNPQFAGRGFEAVAISMIVHPCNPYVPTTHMNLRCFAVNGEGGDTADWYFGGGFDLTPFYPFDDDVVHWHRVAKDATGEHYAQLKALCDEYFYLPHRQETRGVGGVFFDDWTVGGWNDSFEFVQRVGDAFLEAYMPIVERRKDTPYGEREREFQLYRRGRYAEFNLAIDRGTKYGMQSGRRIESVLASLPPLASWSYQRQEAEGSAESRLASYLRPRDWL